MQEANTIAELLQVLDAINVHASRVKLKSGGTLRGKLVVVGADREEVAAISSAQHASAYTDVERTRRVERVTPEGTAAIIESVDAAELQLEHVVVIARTIPRKPSAEEIHALEQQPGRWITRIMRKGAPI